MNYRFLACFSLLYLGATSLPAQDFTWISGSAASNQPASYGTQGTSAPSNTPGGRRRGSAWSTPDGRLWVWGGERTGVSGLFNDLWRWDPTTDQWTWMKGASTANSTGTRGTLGSGTSTTTPGARQYTTHFIGNDGKLWLYGGETAASTAFADMWSYDPGTNVWTWEAGSSLVSVTGDFTAPGVNPGSLVRGASGTDSQGRLILFGGTSSSGANMRDLWRFDTVSKTWTLLYGTGSSSSTGTYGTVGTPGGAPGGRNGAALWIDSSDRIYIFGGTGRGASGTAGLLNDMWRFDPATSQWTWLGGSSSTGAFGNYGTLRVPSSTNWPGARRTPTWDTDSEGQFMLFGGFGNSSFGGGGLQDFWRYNPTTNQWTWTALVNNNNLTDIRGTKGVLSPCNRVEAKSDAIQIAGLPDRKFQIVGSIYGSDGSDVIWEYVLPNLTVDDFSLEDADLLNAPDAGFTNDPTVNVTLNYTGAATYARIAQNNCLDTNNQIIALPALTYTLTGADGLKTIYARVGDDDAQSYSVSTTIRLDTTAPAIGIPLNNTTGSSPAVSGSITELNLRSISVEINGETYIPNVASGAWTIPAGTISPPLTNGSYDIIVTADDRAGNITVETGVDALVVDITSIEDWQKF